MVASPELVWTVLTDLDRLGELVVAHRAFPDSTPCSLGAGTTYSQTLEAAGHGVDIDWTVRARSGRGAHGSDFETSFDLPGGVLASLAAKTAAPDEADAEATLARLKELVER